MYPPILFLGIGRCIGCKCDTNSSDYGTAERQALIHAVSLLKRNAMAAPFERAFALQKQLEAAAGGQNPQAVSGSGATDIMSINYRDDEAFYVIPAVDRVTVVFSTVFKEETDRIFGKVFLQVGPFLYFLTSI